MPHPPFSPGTDSLIHVRRDMEKNEEEVYEAGGIALGKYANILLDDWYSKSFPNIFLTFSRHRRRSEQERRLQYGRCGELALRALLAPDYCQSCLYMMSMF